MRTARGSDHLPGQTPSLYITPPAIYHPPPPPVNRQTPMKTENITFAHTSYAVGKKSCLSLCASRWRTSIDLLLDCRIAYEENVEVQLELAYSVSVIKRRHVPFTWNILSESELDKNSAQLIQIFICIKILVVIVTDQNGTATVSSGHSGGCQCRRTSTASNRNAAATGEL